MIKLMDEWHLEMYGKELPMDDSEQDYFMEKFYEYCDYCNNYEFKNTLWESWYLLENHEVFKGRFREMFELEVLDDVCYENFLELKVTVPSDTLDESKWHCIYANATSFENGIKILAELVVAKYGRSSSEISKEALEFLEGLM